MMKLISFVGKLVTCAIMWLVTIVWPVAQFNMTEPPAALIFGSMAFWLVLFYLWVRK